MRNTKHVRKLWLLVAALVLAFGFAQPASAALQADGPVSDLHGYPIWYEDQTGLRLDLCLDNPTFCFVDPPIPGNEFSEAIGIGGEAFWWLAETSIDEAGVVAELGLALESTWVEDATVDPPAALVEPGNQIVLNRIRIRVDVPVTGTYIVTHPFGTATYEIQALTGGREINETQDLIGSCVEGVCDFTIPLQDGPNPPLDGARVNEDGRSIGPFLTSVDGVVIDPISGNTYLANPLIPTQVLGSPFETNFFRIQGPNGIDVQTDLFVLLGQVSGCSEANEPPIANNDLETTKVGTPVTINVLANDTDVVVLDPLADPPETEVITSPLGTVAFVPGSVLPVGAGTVVVNTDNTVTFTPDAGFTGGEVTFRYTVTDLCGLPSNEASVIVLVEDLLANEAEYRVKTGKWNLSGTSNFRDIIVIDGLETAYATGLFGAQEVPPVTSAASGEFFVIFTDGVIDAFDFDLNIEVPLGTTINRAHIHLGATGVNGGILFNLCGEPVAEPDVPCTVSPEGVRAISGTLTAADFLPVGDVTTFAQAVAAIQSGGTYVNAHSLVNTGGEVRGQIGRNVISLRAAENGPALGAAEVQAGEGPKLPWSFSGKSIGSPGSAPHLIHAESGLAISDTIELRLR